MYSATVIPAAGPRIVRTPKDKEHPYTRTDNRVVQGRQMSPAARLVLIYLLSRPDNWQARRQDIEDYLGCKRDKAQAVLKELQEAGHLVRECRHAGNGRWEWTSTVYEEPRPLTPDPRPENPVTVAPEPENPAPYQNGSPVTTEKKKEDSNNAPARKKETATAAPPYSPWVAGVILDYSRELGDPCNGPANVTQALRLLAASGLLEPLFVEQLHEARRRVRLHQGKQGAGAIANKMAYYFTVLKDLIGVEHCRN